jgi:protein-tyrosine phosphatase
MAGSYPGSLYAEDARPKLRWLLDAGITTFIDLTEAGELEPYSDVLADEADRLGVAAAQVRFPIPDMTPPEPQVMVRVLDAVDGALDTGEAVYVHCMIGMGRTGAVVGCWLVRGGLTGEAALDEMGRLRDGLIGGPMGSPYTAEQRQMVRDWAE